MIDQTTIDGLQRRGHKFKKLLVSLTTGADTERKRLQQELEGHQAEINAANKIIPTLSGDAKKKKIADLKIVSDRIAEVKKVLLTSTDLRLPNTPRPDVPDGDDDTHNLVQREVGKKPNLTHPKDYLALATTHGWIDMVRAAKVSGSRFGNLVGPLAQMEFALIQYAQSVLLKENFSMIVPPVLITEDNMAAMGYLSGGGEDETYHFVKDKLYLVGTSEQSIGPMHRDEVFAEADLPKRYLSFSTCFRREAGSYGKDTKGILRVHQFDKIEMFSFTSPDQSDHEHEFLLAMEEKLWQGLGIPYRVVKLCAGDLGWPSARTYDLEAWLPGQNCYREVCSTSTTTDYQSRQLHIKVDHHGRKTFVHMLNGTAFAIGRTLIAILENYQRSDGTVDIPKALRPWMGGLKRLG